MDKNKLSNINLRKMLPYLIVLVLLACNFSSAYHLTVDQYETIIMNLLDHTSTTYNNAYQLAVRNKDYRFEYSSGI